jgi:hypothetical protein
MARRSEFFASHSDITAGIAWGLKVDQSYGFSAITGEPLV